MNVAVRYKNGDVVVSSVPKYLINFIWFEKFSDVLRFYVTEVPVDYQHLQIHNFTVFVYISGNRLPNHLTTYLQTGDETQSQDISTSVTQKANRFL